MRVARQQTYFSWRRLQPGPQFRRKTKMENNQYKDCIKACLKCAMACEVCAAACLREEKVQMMTRCIELDRDCADICRLAATLMARQSDYVKEFCRLCAKVCRDCAEECGRHQVEHCQRCAEMCCACAEECEKMAA